MNALARLQGVLKWPRDVGPARVVQALALGPGSRLIVVEFGNRQLLIGQSRGGLVALGEAPLRDPAP